MNNGSMIICEDKHGVFFFKNLVQRFKDIQKIENDINVEQAKFHGPCNDKLRRQLTAFHYQRSLDKFLIVADSDDGSQQAVQSRIEKHVPDELREMVDYVIMDYEIEDWICCSESIKIEGKPSETLKNVMRYRKRDLPKYAFTIDIGVLERDSSTFKQFCDFLFSLDSSR